MLTPGVSGAPVLVLGGGLAEDCYRYARANEAGREAVEVCTLSLDREPLSRKDRAATLVNRSVIQLNRREYDAAVRDLNEAIKLEPTLAEAFVNRGAARLGQKRYEEALADLDHGLDLGAPEPAKAWYDKGLAHEDLGDLQAAFTDYKRASELAPAWDLPRKDMARFTVRER
jgi:tetratricopeptide (TPR) repeat protein